MANAAKGPAAIVDGANRFLAGFREFSAGQKAVVIAVLVALLGGGVMFSSWAATPSYAPMFSNLSGADASAIVEKLKADGTPYQLTDGGSTILVPQADVYEARLEMSGAGLPADSETGSALLEESGVTTSDFMEQKRYQQALSKELAKTIKSIAGIDSAVVNLAIPKKDVFLSEQDPNTASVLVGLKPGADLSPEQVTSIVNLVAGGVEGMDPDNVSVVDGKGNTLSVDGTGNAAQQERARDFNAAESARLQQLLEGVFGQGNVKATVTATLNFDEQTETKTEYDYPRELPPLAGSETEERYIGGAGDAATGVLGPDNIQVPAEGAVGSEYTKRSSTDNNALNRTDTVTKAAQGSVQRQSVAVVLDAAKAGAADVEQVTQIVRDATGIDPARGDTVSVVKTAFDATAEAEAAEALAEAKAEEEREAFIGYAKTAALAILVLIMVIVVLFAFRRRKVQEVEVLDVQDLPINLGDITGDLPEPEVLVPAPKPALVAAPVDPALQTAAARRDEVVQLVSRQPQEVAELLRGWLADRRS